MSAALPSGADPFGGLSYGPSSRPRGVERVEGWVVVVILALMSGALLAPLFSPDQNPDSVPWLRTMWLPVYALVAALVLREPLRLSRVAVGAVLCLFLVGWAFASSRWSIQPDVTVRRATALLFTSLFGLYLAARYDWRALLETLAGLFLVLAAGSYVASIGFPHFGANDPVHPGAWNGLWYEKNQMGGLLTHGVLISACAALLSPERRRLWIAAAALGVGAVVMTRSTTSVLAVAIALGGLALLSLLRRGGWVAVATVWAALAGGGGFVAILALAPQLFFGLIGKDASLTGRTDIWAAVLHRVEIRPWLGYGFGAVWTDPWGPAWFIRHEVKWNAPTAHDGWLDILLQLGAVGLVLAALHFVISAAGALVRAGRGPEGDWPLLFMVLFGLFSVSESTIMQYNGLTWVMYTAIAAKLFEWKGLAAGPAPRVGAVRLFPDD